jgi:hypothetical protein
LLRPSTFYKKKGVDFFSKKSSVLRERERWWEGGRGLQICEQKGDGGWLNGGCILNKFVIKPAEFQGQAGARDLGEDR